MNQSKKQNPISKISVFLPISRFVLVWYSIVFLVLSFNFWINITVICYSDDFWQAIEQEITDFILLAVLVLDFIVTFNIGFIQKGRFIKSHKQIAIKYVKSKYFVIDFVVVIICFIQILLGQIFQNRDYTLLDLLIFLKVFKIAKLDQLLVSYILKTSKALFVYELVKNFILLLICCHLFGSMYYLLDAKLAKNNTYPRQMLWIYNSYTFPNIAEQQLWIKQSYALQYILTTLSKVTYGDFTPLNPIEVLYTMFCLVLPLLVYAYLFSSIYGLITNKRENQAKSLAIRMAAQRLSNQLNLNKNIKRKLSFYVQNYIKHRVSSENTFLKQLSPIKQKQFKVHHLQNKFDMSIFKNFDKPTLYSLLLQIVREKFYPQNYHFKDQKALFYLNQGKITQYIKLKHKNFTIQENRRLFGQLTFFTSILEPRIQLRSTEFIVCQTIDQDQFLQKLRIPEYSQLRAKYFQMKYKILLQQKCETIGQICQFCQSKNHVLRNCLNLRGNCSFQISHQSYLRLYAIQNRTKNRRNQIKSQKIFTQQKIYSNSPPITKYKGQYLNKWNFKSKGILFQSLNIDLPFQKVYNFYVN